jgi:acyl-CoA thioesterase-1
VIAAAAHAAQPCEAPSSLVRFNAPLPGLSNALASSKPIRIVALGSSSTQGIGASSPKACYPSRLQAELRKRYPDKEIIVDNLGVGGQLATDMLPRIKKDVLPLHPNAVIWQTGVNDAMRHVDVDTFRRTVMLGIDQFQQAGIDVVLLDMQYFPRAETIVEFPRYLKAMREIAEARKVPILQRFAIMKYLVTSAQYTPQQLLASDLFHPNDVTYGCLGRFLADALQDDVRPIKPVDFAPERAKEAGAVATTNPVR